VKRALATVGVPAEQVDGVLAADAQRRALLTEVERMRAQRAETSKTVGKLPPAERERVVADMRALGDRIAEVEQRVAAAEAAFEAAMLELPNIPHPDVPVGKDETANVVVREVGELPLPQAGFTPKPHWDLGPELGLIDFERGVKVSGSRFYVLTGAGAKLQRALISWMVDLHVNEHGYTEVYPPAMVKRDCLVGTGTLPKFGDTMYRDAEEDLWFCAHRGSDGDQPLPGRGPRGRPATGVPRRLQPMLSPRTHVGGAGRTRHQARSPVRQGRDGQVRRP
jgi:seryl-tRNA synthetase